MGDKDPAVDNFYERQRDTARAAKDAALENAFQTYKAKQAARGSDIAAATREFAADNQRIESEFDRREAQILDDWRRAKG